MNSAQRTLRAQRCVRPVTQVAPQIANTECSRNRRRAKIACIPRSSRQNDTRFMWHHFFTALRTRTSGYSSGSGKKHRYCHLANNVEFIDGGPNIWRSYQQERDRLVHFLRLLAVCWPGAQVHETITFLLVTLPNIHRALIFFILRLSNKPF